MVLKLGKLNNIYVLYFINVLITNKCIENLKQNKRLEYGIWHIFILDLKDTYNYIYEYDSDRYDLNITANHCHIFSLKYE